MSVPNKWVVDPDHPDGRLVPMTPAEQTRYDSDQITGLAAAAAQETIRSNVSAITTALTSRMATLRQARTAIAGGSIFASLSVNERKVIDALLQDDLQFARLILELFDATDA